METTLQVRCPACQARYKVPASAAGKKARCKRCGKKFQIPDAGPDSGRLELTALEELAGGASLRPAVTATPAKPPESSPGAEAALGYGRPPEPETQAVGSGAFAAYFSDLLRAMAFPARAGNLVTFVILWVLLVSSELLKESAPCLGLAPWLIINAWYLSFQLNTVLEAAAGEHELPTLSLTGGWWDDIFVPLGKMLAANALAYLPAIAFLVAMGVSLPAAGGAGLLSSAGGKYLLTSGVLLLCGLFLHPMFVLIVSVGSVGGLLRFDLIFITVARTFLAYLLVVLTVYASHITSRFAAFLLFMYFPVPEGTLGMLSGQRVILVMLINALSLYLTIFSMQAIGFYYHRFKSRFAWSWG